MPNRFTIKDILFLLIGLVVCLLLFLNMVKTNREVEALAGVQEALQDQAKTLQQIQETLADPTDETPLGLMDESDSVEGARVMFRDNFRALPDEAPASGITFSSPSSAVNRLGLAQQWQTAPDSQLPADFAPGRNDHPYPQRRAGNPHAVRGSRQLRQRHPCRRVREAVLA